MSCAKRIVRCTIITSDGKAYSGENACEVPQVKCPRRRGEGYTKCKTICQQIEHAEIAALEKAKYYSGFESLVGSMAIITGIDHLCKECARALSAAGVDEIILRRKL